MLPLFLLTHFSRHLLPSLNMPLITFIRSAFVLDGSQAGPAISAFTPAGGIGRLSAGWLADERGSVRVALTVYSTILVSASSQAWREGGC